MSRLLLFVFVVVVVFCHHIIVAVGRSGCCFETESREKRIIDSFIINMGGEAFTHNRFFEHFGQLLRKKKALRIIRLHGEF